MKNQKFTSLYDAVSKLNSAVSQSYANFLSFTISVFLLAVCDSLILGDIQKSEPNRREPAMEKSFIYFNGMKNYTNVSLTAGFINYWSVYDLNHKKNAAVMFCKKWAAAFSKYF